MSFSIITAMDQKRGIGKNNTIPWHLSGEFKYFAETTKRVVCSEKHNTVIMGSKTCESLPEAYRPLPGRLNIILNRESDPSPSLREGLGEGEGTVLCTSLDDALADLAGRDEIENVFVIGGGQIYVVAIEHPECNTLYVTEIHKTFDCDTFFPKIPNKFKEVSRSEIQEEKGIEYQFVKYEK